ncbi:MAG TPA: hypothetical protein VF828_03025 [Patescibacteria group bacterium]
MKYLNAVTSEFFKVFFALFLFLFFLERLKEGTVSLYINLDFILLATVVSGLVSLATTIPQKTKLYPQEISWSNLVYLGFIANLVLFILLSQFGLFALIISFLSSTVIVIMYYFLVEDNLR